MGGAQSDVETSMALEQCGTGLPLLPDNQKWEKGAADQG